MTEVFDRIAELPLSQRYAFGGNLFIAIGTAFVSLVALLKLVEDGSVPTNGGSVFGTASSAVRGQKKRALNR